MKNLEERLLKALKTRERATKKLLEVLNQAEEDLLEIIPEDSLKLGHNFEFKGISIRKWQGSQWGATYLAINGNQIPLKIESLGSGYYYMNDFNHYIELADTKDIIYLANNIYDYVEYVVEQLEKDAQQLKELDLNKIQELLLVFNK